MQALLWIQLAMAGGDVDYSEEAKRRMKLSFDYEAAQEMVDMPAPAAAATAYGGVPQAALKLEPNATVDTVVVYPDRAIVTRTRTLQVPAGSSAVRFEGLPLGIDAGSLHAELRAGKAQVVGVERVSGQGDVDETARIAAIRDEAKALTAELGAVQDRLESLLAQRAYLRATLGQAGRDQPQPALATVKTNLDYVGQTEAEIARKLRVEEERAQELDKQLSPLLLKLQDSQATGATVRLDIEADKAQEATFALSYQVIGASWRPSYNARLDPATNQVELSYYGMVTNRTGDVWKDAALELSTANPAIAGNLPVLSSWVLGEGSGLDLGEQTYAIQQAATLTPQAQTGGGLSASRPGNGAVVFPIAGRRTIPGDGSETRLPVGSASFPVTFEYIATPRLVPEVFRRGHIRYQGDVPLAPGELSTFVGANYVGTTSVPAVPAGEELVLSFGTDDRFKVERVLLQREIDHPGAGRKTLRYTFHFQIRVTNHSTQPQDVLLTDQIPVSEVDRITVKLGETTPFRDPAPEDPPGILRWPLHLAPGQTQTIDLRFSVTGPIDEAPQLQMLDYAM